MTKLLRIIEWVEDVREPVPEAELDPRATYPNGPPRRTIGTRRMRAEVVIELDDQGAARDQGRKAHENKSRKCVDGWLTVRAVGKPIELGRTMK